MKLPRTKYQITERPADPPPMRRKLEAIMVCPECGAPICQHALDAMNGHAAHAARLEEALRGAVSLIEETDWTAFSLSDRAKLDAARAALAEGEDK